MIPYYMRRAVPSGRTYEVGAAWVWPMALKAKALLQSIGLFVAVDQAAGWILGAFSSAAGASESGAQIPTATRAYYLGVLDDWWAAAQAKVAADRRAFVLPVIARAREIMTDPAATHADLSVAVRGVAAMVEQQATLSGTPLGEPLIQSEDLEGEVITGELVVELDPVPAGAVLVPSPGDRIAAAAVGPPGWMVLGAVAGLVAWGWWRYGR